MPKQPAIVYVHVIALSFDWISLGGDLHLGEHYEAVNKSVIHNVFSPLGMAQYYDIPTIKWVHIHADHWVIGADCGLAVSAIY